MGSILGHLENSLKYLKHLASAVCFMSLSIRISSQFETFAHTSTRTVVLKTEKILIFAFQKRSLSGIHTNGPSINV